MAASPRTFRFRCWSCDQVLPSDDFYTGKVTRCMACTKDWVRLLRDAESQNVKARVLRMKRAFPEMSFNILEEWRAHQAEQAAGRRKRRRQGQAAPHAFDFSQWIALGDSAVDVPAAAEAPAVAVEVVVLEPVPGSESDESAEY